MQLDRKLEMQLEILFYSEDPVHINVLVLIAIDQCGFIPIYLKKHHLGKCG